MELPERKIEAVDIVGAHMTTWEPTLPLTPRIHWPTEPIPTLWEHVPQLLLDCTCYSCSRGVADQPNLLLCFDAESVFLVVGPGHPLNLSGRVLV